MTTTTVFAGANDFWVLNHDDSYANARSGAAGTKFMDVGNEPVLFVGQADPAHAGGYECMEIMLEFDTSSIPDTDTIDSGVFSIWGSNDNDPGDLMTVQLRAYDWGGTMQDTDWRSDSQLNALTLCATLAPGSLITTDYNDFASQAGMVGSVNKTGFSRYVLCSNRHIAGTVSVEEYLQLISADTSGTTNDPKLVVNHTTAAPSGQPTAKRRGGVQFAAHAPGSHIRRW